MTFQYVDRIDDPRLIPYRDLKLLSRSKWHPDFIAEGWLVVERLLQSPHQIHSVLVADNKLDRYETIRRADIPTIVVPEPLSNEIVGFNFHTGIVSHARRPANVKPEEVESLLLQNRLVVICPDTNNPDNIGSIVRLCAAFDVAALLVGPSCPDPYLRRCIRLSMGTVFKLPIMQHKDLLSLVKEWQNRLGLLVSGAVLSSQSIPLADSMKGARTALVMGNEYGGLPPEWCSACDQQVMIPMAEGVDSLNVASSASIILYHFARLAKARGM